MIITGDKNRWIGVNNIYFQFNMNLKFIKLAQKQINTEELWLSIVYIEDDWIQGLIGPLILDRQTIYIDKIILSEVKQVPVFCG